MGKLNKKIAKLFGLDGDWDELQFTCHNPTDSDVYFDMFNPFVALGYNVPNTPFGYVQPPVVDGIYGYVPTPPPYVDPNAYPTISSTKTYFVVGDNHTITSDVNHSRLYMTYGDGANWYVTWKDLLSDFFTTSITLGSTILVDSDVSITSNKIFILSEDGQVFIINTNTNTLITTLNLPFFGHNHYKQIKWNSFKNTFYVTCIDDTIYEIDGVLNTLISTIVAPVGSRPYAIDFKALTNEMFVTYSNTNQIASLNCTTNVLTTIIVNTITNNPTSLFYNLVTDLITYGSNTVVGVRTFNATTLVFSASVIKQTIRDIGFYPVSNKIYLLRNDNQIQIIDGNTLNSLAVINPSATIGILSQITYYPFDGKMYFNIDDDKQQIQKVGILKNQLLFWIDGTDDYNQSMRDFFERPCWVRRIYMYAKDTRNFTQSINHVYKDANGDECQIPVIPSLSVSVNQFQGWIAEIDMEDDETVFGVNQWYQQMLFKSNTEVTFVVIYKQIDKSKMLLLGTGLRIGETIADEYASCPLKVRKWNDKDLALWDTNGESPYKQNMFKGQFEGKDKKGKDMLAVKPFNAIEFNKIVYEKMCEENTNCEPQAPSGIVPFNFKAFKEIIHENICKDCSNCEEK